MSQTRVSSSGAYLNILGNLVGSIGPAAISLLTGIYLDNSNYVEFTYKFSVASILTIMCFEWARLLFGSLILEGEPYRVIQIIVATNSVMASLALVIIYFYGGVAGPIVSSLPILLLYCLGSASADHLVYLDRLLGSSLAALYVQIAKALMITIPVIFALVVFGTSQGVWTLLGFGGVLSLAMVSFLTKPWTAKRGDFALFAQPHLRLRAVTFGAVAIPNILAVFGERIVLIALLPSSFAPGYLFAIDVAFRIYSIYGGAVSNYFLSLRRQNRFGSRNIVIYGSLQVLPAVVFGALLPVFQSDLIRLIYSASQKQVSPMALSLSLCYGTLYLLRNMLFEAIFFAAGNPRQMVNNSLLVLGCSSAVWISAYVLDIPFLSAFGGVIGNSVAIGLSFYLLRSEKYIGPLAFACVIVLVTIAGQAVFGALSPLSVSPVVAVVAFGVCIAAFCVGFAMLIRCVR
ncbi:hypothetical protein [Pleomorphomonas sp. NRK KF1]|uniref:hypothetical protein n=1 Tax=Pleomorphomonas sp. NRK KF1 TaxID=2943000 RepID=UPI002043AA03|nr:hypothetical protein [Pleomorphomonas sp. NRK KF1]MCM5555942.1 hypothetical protein [Pleomorphomonas sp. NRK KF1]